MEFFSQFSIDSKLQCYLECEELVIIFGGKRKTKIRKKKELTPNRNVFHTADKLQATILFHCNPEMNKENFWYDPVLGLSS